MSCSEYDFLERAFGKAVEEVDRLRLLAMSSGSASAMDALVGAELTKTIIGSARSRHLRDCAACVGARWHPQVQVESNGRARF